LHSDLNAAAIFAEGEALFVILDDDAI